MGSVAGIMTSASLFVGSMKFTIGVSLNMRQELRKISSVR